MKSHHAATSPTLASSHKVLHGHSADNKPHAHNRIIGTRSIFHTTAQRDTCFKVSNPSEKNASQQLHPAAHTRCHAAGRGCGAQVCTTSENHNNLCCNEVQPTRGPKPAAQHTERLARIIQCVPCRQWRCHMNARPLPTHPQHCERRCQQQQRGDSI